MIGALVSWLAACAATPEAASPPPERAAHRPRGSRRGSERVGAERVGALRVGDVAPDAALVGVDGSETTLLAHLRPGRPLVLIFGSFT